MSTTLEKQILVRALKLIEAGHTHKAYARDKDGNIVDFSSEAAVSFCALGAIMRACHEVIGGDPAAEFDFFLRVWNNVSPNISGVSDHLGAPAVKYLFRKRLEEMQWGAGDGVMVKPPPLPGAC